MTLSPYFSHPIVLTTIVIILPSIVITTDLNVPNVCLNKLWNSLQTHSSSSLTSSDNMIGSISQSSDQQLIQMKTKTKHRFHPCLDQSEDECEIPCSEEQKPGEDVLLDQLETLFSTLGHVWSLGTIPTSILVNTLYSKPTIHYEREI